MARETFQIDLICPGCGADGYIIASEDYETKHPSFRVEEYRHFYPWSVSRYRFKTDMYCKACGRSFTLGEVE
jgi:hypothetical protein